MPRGRSPLRGFDRCRRCCAGDFVSTTSFSSAAPRIVGTVAIRAASCHFVGTVLGTHFVGTVLGTRLTVLETNGHFIRPPSRSCQLTPVLRAAVAARRGALVLV